MIPSQPRPAAPRFELIDSLRALAAGSVFLYHLAAVRPTLPAVVGKLFRHGNAGVVLFFLISGFLLYRPFVAARAGQGRPVRVRDFYVRRVLRIVPAYWLALTLLALYPGLPDFGHRWWQFYALGQIYDPHTTFAGIGPAWSLCIEASFYLVLPLYAVVMDRALAGTPARRRTPVELAALAGLAALSAGLHQWIHQQGASGNLGFTLPGTFYLFAVGMGVAVMHVHWQATGSAALARLARWAPACWLAAAALYVGLSLTISAQTLGSVHPVYALVALLILAPAVAGPRGRAARALAWRPLALAGLISYAFYLWHQPILFQLARHVHAVGLLGLSAAALTIGVACLSYVLVERPAQRRGRSALAARAAPATAVDVGEPAPLITG
jgi:peptidoglycan/LPS O-acetylase OafA/YrhL